MRKLLVLCFAALYYSAMAQIKIVDITDETVKLTNIPLQDTVLVRIQNNKAYTQNKFLKVPYNDTIEVPRIWCNCRIGVEGDPIPVVVDDSINIVVYDMPLKYRSVGVKITGKERKYNIRVSDYLTIDKLIYINGMQSYGNYKPKISNGDYQVFIPYGHKGFHTIEVISTEKGCKVHSITYKHIW